MYYKQIENKIDAIDRKIAQNAKMNQKLLKQKAVFVNLQKLLPDAKISRNKIYSASVASEISRMEVKTGYGTIEFHLFTNNKKYGMNIYLQQSNTVAAQFDSYYSKNITIFDFEKMIPDSIPNKVKFSKRIKRKILQLIARNKLTISTKSHDYDSYSKLLMLA